MKTNKLRAIGSFLLLFFLSGIVPMQAKDVGYIIINGIVKDKLTNRKLDFVNISVPGTSIGTVTNAEGGFSIKVTDSIHADVIEISHLGYLSQRIPLKGEDIKEITIYLVPKANTLPEVLIRGINPLLLVQEAVDKIPKNNSVNTNLLTGFYRETVKKRRTYINVTEAIVSVYKTSYENDINRDRIQIYKGRQLLSPKTSDTLVVKLQGGPNCVIYLDIVKNHSIFFDQESLKDYKFKMETPVMLDEKPHYVVSFEPRVVEPYPLFYGKFYIDEENLAFTRAVFSYSMKDRSKITNAILKKKPFNLRFKPEEITYYISYRQENGVTYLNYMRNEIKFKCDWKRKLFSTSYEVVSEVVITDKKLDNVSTISSKFAFNNRSILSDKVNDFYDEDFWEGYNIIEPTESLESAVNKLKKKYD